MRKIIHIDQDAFFAAVELKYQPHLRNKPVAVGGQNRRGVLTTCSYKAREFGCHSGQPVFQALQKCPHLIVLPPRFDLYVKESHAIRKIFYRYTDVIECPSIDEAYLDVTHRSNSGWEIAHEIRAAIRKECRLPSSAGIASNKLLAKIACDWNKPNGQFEINPEDVDTFMKELPVRKLWGVGPKSEMTFKRMGITTCSELQKIPLEKLVRIFGIWGADLYQLCRGIDHREVETEYTRKSLSIERTFSKSLDSFEAASQKLSSLFARFLRDLEQSEPDRKICGIFIKLKFSDFKITTAARAHAHPELQNYLSLLQEGMERNQNPIRLIGIGVRFEDELENEQLEFEGLITESSTIK